MYGERSRGPDRGPSGSRSGGNPWRSVFGPSASGESVGDWRRREEYERENFWAGPGGSRYGEGSAGLRLGQSGLGFGDQRWLNYQRDDAHRWAASQQDLLWGERARGDYEPSFWQRASSAQLGSPMRTVGDVWNDDGEGLRGGAPTVGSSGQVAGYGTRSDGQRYLIVDDEEGWGLVSEGGGRTTFSSKDARDRALAASRGSYGEASSGVPDWGINLAPGGRLGSGFGDPGATPARPRATRGDTTAAGPGKAPPIGGYVPRAGAAPGFRGPSHLASYGGGSVYRGTIPPRGLASTGNFWGEGADRLMAGGGAIPYRGSVMAYRTDGGRR